MTLDGSLSQREEISWPKMGILKWPLTFSNIGADFATAGKAEKARYCLC